MTPTTSPTRNAQRLAIVVRGVVQGVGFRPFVYNTARSLDLTGWVLNEADTVQIELQGTERSLSAFLDALRRSPPPQARVDDIEVREMACQEGPPEPFAIRVSSGRAAPRPSIPADLATCPACRAEIADRSQRRHRYPFTNCTNCGPRWSIIAALPYDRPRTAMARFALCPACASEYHDPADRRFHAQPIACPQCGPELRLLDAVGRELSHGDDALRTAVAAIGAGRIVALKGLGGFQLLVDATNAEAVARLRQRKRRPDKPFAVMLPSLADVRVHCRLSADEATALGSPQAPILLVRRLTPGPQTPVIATAVAPDNPYLGVMLPYTPLHHLLMEALQRPIVCTSGNLSEEPMAISTRDALERLGPIADVLLTHNRPILRPVDDSVAQCGPTGVQILRRARGCDLTLRKVPGSVLAAENAEKVPGTLLAVGGHLKNTVALAMGGEVVLGPHVGDLDNVLSVEVHRRAIRDLVEFFQVRPDAVACDLHPDYASTRVAESLAAQWDVPLVRVQHHHAHVAACAAENGLEGPVLGLAWDGTGYGPDGTVWGGEALVCEGAQFTRVAHLRPFPLPGGDRAVREPRRSALGLLWAVDRELAARQAGAWFAPAELKTLWTALERSLHAPRTTSLGRLFDAVAALCGLPLRISFEGQAAMALQFAADESSDEAYPFPLLPGAPAVADWEPLVRGVLADRAAAVPVGRISARFHNALAGLAVAIARRSGCSQIALSGGCFQNVLLADRVQAGLRGAGFHVSTHHQVPPGDGGIALGQILVAVRQLRGSSYVPGNSR